MIHIHDVDVELPKYKVGPYTSADIADKRALLAFKEHCRNIAIFREIIDSERPNRLYNGVIYWVLFDV